MKQSIISEIFLKHRVKHLSHFGKAYKTISEEVDKAYNELSEDLNHNEDILEKINEWFELNTQLFCIVEDTAYSDGLKHGVLLAFEIMDTDIDD